MCLVFIRDGSTRCGLFICAQAAMEKVKAEQQVDLYYPMMMAKLIGEKGTVYCVDIQQKMLDLLKKRAAEQKVTNFKKQHRDIIRKMTQRKMQMQN